MEFVNSKDFPPELATSVANLEQAIIDMEACVEKIISVPLSETHAQLKPLDKAKHDIACVYAVTSLYWAYMKTKGLDPKEHGLLKELDRIKEAMGRSKQIADKPFAPKLDVSAARRFIRGGLWEAKSADQESEANSTSSAERPSEGPSLAKKMRLDSCV